MSKTIISNGKDTSRKATRVTRLAYLFEKLRERHPDKEFFCGFQCGLVDAGVRDGRLHDDTCAIITSDGYLRL